MERGDISRLKDIADDNEVLSHHGYRFIILSATYMINDKTHNSKGREIS